MPVSASQHTRSLGKRRTTATSVNLAMIIGGLAVGLTALLAPGSARAQWTTESPSPTFLDVRGVASPSADRVFLATDDDSFDDGGALFESVDGGTTWTQRDVPFSLGSPLNGIFFLDDQLGWTFGNANYRTTDSGTTWTELPVLGSIYQMEFFTPTFGFAAGGGTFRYVSRDAGDTWVDSPEGMFDFAFADDLVAIGLADSALYRSTDGGDSFSLLLEGEPKAVTFATDTVALAIVEDTFHRSTDAGISWTPGESAAGRGHLEVLSPDVLVAWGRSGSFPDFDDQVLRSTDGGITWADLGEIAPAGIWAMTVVDPLTLVVADINGDMFHSADAGLTWSPSFTSPGPKPSFLSSAKPAFADAITGYFGYGNGFVIKTADGGATWTQVSSGAGATLNDIARFPNGDLIAVGESGTVLTSRALTAATQPSAATRQSPATAGTQQPAATQTNQATSAAAGGGPARTPWTLQPAFTNLSLQAIDLVGADGAVIVDENGRVYRSSDRGNSWTAGASMPGSLDAEDLDFSTLLDGWVIGFGFGAGALFHTTDGGDSWTAVPDFLGGYYAVDFEGSSGWASNVSGLFYRSTDDGDTWTSGQLPGSPLSIQDMDFYDVSIGYAVGRWGYAARSEDGGLSWETLPTPNSDDMFTDIYLLGPNELWISTAHDVAYYSATGGQNWAVLEIGSNGFGSFSGIVANAEGDAWTAGFQGYIERFDGPPPPPLNRPPEASFDFETTGLSVDFTDTSSDPDGMVVDWFWDFGDSSFSAEQNPSHTYLEEDTYIVRLTVTDDDGATGSWVRFITVQPQPGGVFGDFTEVTPLDPLFVTPQDEDFWVATTAPADYDGDNDLDIAVFGFYVVYNESVEQRLVLLRNDGELGPGEWEFAYIDLPLDGLSSGASDLAWGDADNDGDEDLLVGTNGETVLYRNDGGTLVPTATELPGYYEDNDQADFDLQSITWVDFDNDNDLDLFLPSVYVDSTFSYRTALLRNDGQNETGDWTFTDVDAGFAPTGHAQSTWVDFDQDQDLDLLLTHLAPLTPNGFIRRYRNDGDSGFVGEDILGDLTVEHGEVQWGDYDQDGDYDVLVAGNIGEVDGTFTHAALRIYRNDNETYVPFEVIECVPCEGWFDITAATWADYDSDGDIDILLTGSYNSGSAIEGRAKILANEGGTFVDSGNDLPAPKPSGTRGGTFSWLDLDSDLDLDYFIAGGYYVPGGNGLIEAQMHAYRNDVGSQNSRPSIPDNLSSEVTSDGLGTGSSVHLSWDAATDDHTASVALTYNLELYRDGEPIVLASPLPQPGNVSATTEWTLTDLPDGVYRWTVQALDTSYGASAVAEAFFTAGDPASTDTEGTPSTFTFSNHPNPVVDRTTFRYALPVDSSVRLSIYDVEGRRIAALIDRPVAAGRQEAVWETGSLPGGVYFARFEADGFAKTARVLVVR